MTRPFLTLAAILAASPALAAEGAFFTLSNTNFVVLVAFLLFIGVLAYFRVPETLMALLDKRAVGIRKDLDEARALREEAQSLLASYERKHQDMQAQADRIVLKAKDDANAAATQAKADLEKSIARRLHAAEDQIASAEASAIRQVRDRAIQVAVAAAGDVISKKMDAKRADAMIDESIETVGAKLH